MRVLSPLETRETQGIEQVPIDLRHCYFPVVLRLSLDGSEHSRCLDHEDIRGILNHASAALDLIRLRTEGDSCLAWHEPKRMSVCGFRLGQSAETQSFISAYGLFPTAHLISFQQLEALNLSPRPGYLYIGLETHCYERERSCDGSVFLDEESYFSAVETPRRECYENSLRRRIGRRGIGDLPPSDLETPTHSWRGRIADIEQLLNGREIFRGEVRQGKEHGRFREASVIDHVVETPLEMSPGFVMDTVLRLRRRSNEIPHLLAKIDEMVFEAAAIKEEGVAAIGVFPRGEDILPGIETKWRFVQNAWLMQSLLMARLIGGAFWRYTVRRIENELTGQSLHRIDL